MDDVADLVQSWQAGDSALPRLTWYGPGGERVELSGRVLANWVIKVANLLTEEADAAPGTVVALDLPAHWRALVWAVGAWLTGAQVVWPDPGHSGVSAHDDDTGRAALVTETSWEVLVTDRPDAAPQVPVLIAVALPALAMAYAGQLPPGAIDGAGDLMTFPDHLVLPVQAAALAPICGPAWSGPGRVLLRADLPVAQLVAQVLGIWRAGASVVLVADPQADAAHLAGIEGAEQVTSAR